MHIRHPRKPKLQIQIIRQRIRQPQPRLFADQIAAQHHGQVSVFAKKALKTGETVALKADEPVQTASVIKLALLYEAMEQIRAGKAHWDDKVVLTKENQTDGSGVLGFFDAPLTLTLKDVLFMMVAMIVSNVAARVRQCATQRSMSAKSRMPYQYTFHFGCL